MTVMRFLWAYDGAAASPAGCAKIRSDSSRVNRIARSTHPRNRLASGAGRISTGKDRIDAPFAPLVKLDTTTEIAQRFTANGPSPLASLPGMLMAAGGIAIKTGAEVIGAIGVGGAPGGNLDEACAKSGIDKIRGQLGG
jgi:hypothetical protein